MHEPRNYLIIKFVVVDNSVGFCVNNGDDVLLVSNRQEIAGRVPHQVDVLPFRIHCLRALAA